MPKSHLEELQLKVGQPGAFFTFTAAIAISAFTFTIFYRVFAAASSRLEIALRYCGLLLLTVMVCGGYVRPINRLVSEVPWLGWLTVGHVLVFRPSYTDVSST